jgi:small subunit ribosomal protein S5
MPPRNHRNQSDNQKERSEFEEIVVQIDRVTRVVKGGRRLRFRALVVVGNKKGRVGAGIAKDNEVQGAVAKAVIAAKKNLITVPLTATGSIPHEITHQFGATTVLLKPAAEGTSLIAGGGVRPVVALAGIENIISKNIGSNNRMNVVMATVQALRNLTA